MVVHHVEQIMDEISVLFAIPIIDSLEISKHNIIYQMKTFSMSPLAIFHIDKIFKHNLLLYFEIRRDSNKTNQQTCLMSFSHLIRFFIVLANLLFGILSVSLYDILLLDTYREFLFKNF